MAGALVKEIKSAKEKLGNRFTDIDREQSAAERKRTRDREECESSSYLN